MDIQWTLHSSLAMVLWENGGAGDQTSSNRGAWTFSLGQFFDQVGKRLIVINFGLQKYEANALGLVKSWGSIRKGWFFVFREQGVFQLGLRRKSSLDTKMMIWHFTTCMNVMCKVGKKDIKTWAVIKDINIWLQLGLKTYLGFSGPNAAYCSHDVMWLLNCLNYSGLRVPIVPVNEPTAERYKRCMIHVKNGPVGWTGWNLGTFWPNGFLFSKDL